MMFNRLWEPDMTDWMDRLNRMKMGKFRSLFSELTIPEKNALDGFYKGFFVGPSWLRIIAGPLLVITGLGGWWGKRFNGDDTAINLVKTEGQLKPKFPMQLIDIPSLIDNKPGLTLQYDKRNPFPWPYITDELRQLDPGIYLGMTYIRIKPVSRITLPFLLQHQENFNGL